MGMGLWTRPSPWSLRLSRIESQTSQKEFQRSQLTELGNTDFEGWANESFETATKIAYRNG
jgi:hypothetical protein